jgi:hypothetical protein
MRKAFGPGKTLADSGRIDAEEVALAHLFAGAIGLFKNPSSHREVDIKTPEAAAEPLFLASHLLRVVEARVNGLAGAHST